MTPGDQKEYIITEEQLQDFIYSDDFSFTKEEWADAIRSRPYKSVEQFVPNLHTCEHKEIRNGVEFCHFHNAPTQSSEAVLDNFFGRLENAAVEGNCGIQTEYFVPWSDIDCLYGELKDELRAQRGREQG